MAQTPTFTKRSYGGYFVDDEDGNRLGWVIKRDGYWRTYTPTPDTVVKGSAETTREWAVGMSYGLWKD